MLNIEKNHNLAQYTTFKAGGTAEYFTIVKTEDDLIEAIAFSRFHKLPVVILKLLYLYQRHYHSLHLVDWLSPVEIENNQ